MKKITEFTDISVRGKWRTAPAIRMDGLTLVVSGRLIKTAHIKGEFWLPREDVGDPELIIERLRRERPGVDIFRFAQKLPQTEPLHKFPMEWDNLAAIPVAGYEAWWEKLPQVTRKNVRRSAKRGVEIRRVAFDDGLVQAIVEINNDSNIRQGGRFYHYGKSFDTVKRDYSAEFLDRSDFLAAYHGQEIIGIMRIVYVGEAACLLQLLCKSRHFDKRPANALIAGAVELCVEKGKKYLTYGRYVYPGNLDSPLTEFKRRNGFESFPIPTYHVPLTWKGRIALKLGLHLGPKHFIPARIQKIGRDLRNRIVAKGGQETAAGDAE